jgi:hypothetical protein
VIVFKTNTGFSKLSGTPQPEVTNALGLDLMYQGNHSKNREYLQAMAFALDKKTNVVRFRDVLTAAASSRSLAPEVLIWMSFRRPTPP